MSSVLILGVAAALTAGNYEVAAGWMCQNSPGLLAKIEDAPKWSEWSADLKRNVERAGCMPILVGAPNPVVVSVMAFQGEYAYACRILNPKDIGGPYDLPTYSCVYVRTRNLRDSDGKVPSPQTSKRSPSPKFFDNARELKLPE